MDNLKKLIHSSEYNNEFSQKLLSFENYFTDIYKVCKNSFEIGCGSYLFDGQNYKYQIETYQKQKSTNFLLLAISKLKILFLLAFDKYDFLMSL